MIFQNIARQMMRTTDPKDHQRLGRQAKGFSHEKWDAREPNASQTVSLVS